MACSVSVVVLAYIYHDERLQIFSVESFDSEDFNKLPFAVSRKGTSKLILHW